MKVVLRINETTKCVHGNRDMYSSKTACILDCVGSLLESIGEFSKGRRDIEVFAVMDRVEDTTKAKIKDLAARLSIPIFFFKCQPGNASSFNACLNIATKFDRGEYVFFVEDDYKFERNAIGEIVAFLNKFDGKIMINPVLDLNDFVSFLKKDGKYERTIVLPGHGIYWKQIYHTTKTFLINVGDLIDNKSIYDAEIKTGQLTGQTNEVTRRVPCFCPLTVIARHMQTKKTLDIFESGEVLEKYTTEAI